ncbi:unnamed protein product [Amoebophrya sp. A120]|nr:unnamed protein product [Amoebophrya sp. A120]|eukprot:GSA120T00008616001.1
MSHLPVALSLAPVELRGRSSASLSRGLRKQGTNGTSTTGRNTGAGLCLVCALGRVLFHFLRWPTRTTWIVHLLFLFLKKTPVHHAFVRHDETAVTTTRGSSTSREEDRDVDIKEEALVVLAPNQDQQVQELDGTEIKNFAGGHHAPTVDAKDHSRSRQLGSTSSGSSFILTTMEVKPAGAAPAGDEQDEQGGLFDELLRPADEDVLHPQGGLQVKAEISTGKNKKPATQTNLRGRRSQRRVSSRAKAPAKSADMAVSASSGSTSGSTRTEPPSADLGAKSEKQEEEISSSGVLSLLPSWMVNLPDT